MTSPHDLTKDDRARLQATLNAHRRRAADKHIAYQNIRVDDLLAKLKRSPLGYLCACGQVLAFGAGVDPQRPDKATVGHHFPLSAPANDEHPGHTLPNTDFECWSCNSRQNHTQDTPGIARGKRMAVKPGRAKKAAGQSRSIAKRQDAWPAKGSRKIKSRSTFR